MLVDDGPVTADLHSITVVALMGRHELDAAVAVPMVVPIDKRYHPLTSGLLAGEWTAWVVRPVFRRAEQRLGIGVVVRHPWHGEGSEYAQFLQPAFERCATHGVAVIGVENQWLPTALADLLSQTSPADQIRCDGSILSLSNAQATTLRLQTSITR